ncbi:hypothetical protein GCM10023262_13590 [Bartonella pachyuromydis]|uniref:Uncharacterized protein n=1 Tax=Bartonella pachyuromydis TaxID=931097 RepID=A0ABP8VME9_9HYPH
MLLVHLFIKSNSFCEVMVDDCLQKGCFCAKERLCSHKYSRAVTYENVSSYELGARGGRQLGVFRIGGFKAKERVLFVLWQRVFFC